MATLLRALLTLAGVGVAAFGAAALWFAGPGPSWLRAALAAALVAAMASALAQSPLRRAALLAGAVALVLFGWWSSLRASGTREWMLDVSRTPRAEIRGDLVTLRDVRNFRYRSESDFDARWEDRTYDLRKLRTLDLFLSSWGSPHIAHTILSWGFDDGQHLAVSIETRKEQGEAYSALAGFFRNYELVYVAADERDVIGLRTNHRGEQVRLYRLKTTPEAARTLLLDYLVGMNELARHPRWYNAFTTNCTTTIRVHIMDAGLQSPFDWRLLANGHLDELLLERGTLGDPDPSIESLRARSLVNERARAAGDAPDFSARIRAATLPPPAAARRPPADVRLALRAAPVSVVP